MARPRRSGSAPEQIGLTLVGDEATTGRPSSSSPSASGCGARRVVGRSCGREGPGWRPKLGECTCWSRRLCAMAGEAAYSGDRSWGRGDLGGGRSSGSTRGRPELREGGISAASADFDESGRERRDREREGASCLPCIWIFSVLVGGPHSGYSSVYNFSYWKN